MIRKNLIYFCGAAPVIDPAPAAAAYHFATVAARTGLEAEVRPAGASVRVALPGAIAGSEKGRELDERVRAGATAAYSVALWPVSVGARGVSDEQVAAIGAVLRPLGEIQTDVAEGPAELIYMGGCAAGPGAGPCTESDMDMDLNSRAAGPARPAGAPALGRAIEDAGREGRAPIDAAPDSPAAQALTTIARRLLEPPLDVSGKEA